MLPRVSIAFITYKRIEHLRLNFGRLLSFLNYPRDRLELIVADDGSDQMTQGSIRALSFDKFVLSPKNFGLGHNNNCALRACTSPYILLMQDDWYLEHTPDILLQCIDVFESDPDVGLIPLTGNTSRFATEERVTPTGRKYWVVVGYLEVKGRLVSPYSDQPHVRRAELNDPDVLGLYMEGGDMEACESNYEARFIEQGKYKAAFLRSGELDYFRTTGIDTSFRTSKPRYKLDALLLNVRDLLHIQPNSRINASCAAVYRKMRRALVRFGVL